MHWEKLSVAFNISVDLEKTVIPHIEQELRNSAGFSWVGYNTAAMFCSNSNIDLEKGLAWAEQSINIESRFENLETKSRILRQMGKTAEADSVLKVALDKSTTIDNYSYGRQLLDEGKPKEAMDVFKMNLKKNPDTWFAHAGMARGYQAQGNMDSALEELQNAIAKAPDNVKANLSRLQTQWQSQQKK